MVCRNSRWRGLTAALSKWAPLTAAVLAAFWNIAPARADDYCDKMRSDIEKARCQATKFNRVPPEDLARAEAGPTHIGWVYDAELSPDGKFAITSHMGSDIRMWNIAGGEMVRQFGERVNEP